MTVQPFSPVWLIRILSLIVVILALTAGYYQALYQTERLKYEQLELEYQQTIGENR